VIHSQRTDESVCAHSAGSAMADCPQRDRANGPRDQEEKHRWSSAMSHSIIVGLARLRRHPLPAGLGQRSRMSPEPRSQRLPSMDSFWKVDYNVSG
jgi:hypothetical protein